MIRLAMILAMLAGPVFGAAPKSACFWLKLAQPELVLGAPVTLTRGFSRRIDTMSMSLCTAQTATGEQLALLYRVTPDEPRSLDALVQEHCAELGAVMGPAPAFELLDLGAAALWEETLHQLTVWSHDGGRMMVLTFFGAQARPRCIAVAEAILAAGG
ncbi:hypothetical protein [Rhodobacter maris]|uniref:Uncharacterized protein n=1 Tax=Rhodobacter maris TaxID=446682 RepID=A0A285TAM2_9RHOB|nr:hypothetical protein [Rhodobacter maris]SOC18438.1 hypothetical protein SAMN05877831_11664 [Rhodobacter maris]